MTRWLVLDPNNVFDQAKVLIINEEDKKPAIVDHMAKLKLLVSADKQTNPVFRFGKLKYPSLSKFVNLYECNEVSEMSGSGRRGKTNGRFFV